MKKWIIFGLFFIGFNLFAQHKSLKVAYKVNAKQSKEKPVLKETFLLLVNGDKSLFINNNKIVLDSLAKRYFQQMRKESNEPNRILLKYNSDKEKNEEV